jgi:hypothetical protein
MKNRTLQVLLLGLTAVAATAHCGKSEPTLTPPLGPTDVVVTWTFDGKPASAAECTTRGGVTVSVTLSATNDPSLHQNATAACEKGTVTFSALDTAGLGSPFVEGALLDDKGVTVTRADTTARPTPGKTAVTLDFFPTTMTTSGDPATTSGDPSTAASSGGGGMGGMGGMSSTSAGSTAASTAAATAASSGAGGADAGS